MRLHVFCLDSKPQVGIEFGLVVVTLMSPGAGQFLFRGFVYAGTVEMTE
jgi:hypothetical protein